ncbi:SRPBCC family protein [Virgisporangium aurantiacum]|uniref:Polyketide cyclase / dehydrase and lipid transport n=1 Tax=Virgisporangium aurantiacum TaxID=175570 RepID=A0A8J3Z705_9ACTN|nr:SRPBCC family protein [Virgisporangium aurantiacum]GIJ56460.1 hypothetical protein Vau01_039760 [Virgisporangium aurantiacum]
MSIELGSGQMMSTAPPTAFFARWADHATWPEWDPDTLWVRMDGPVGPGATGRIKPRGGPAVRFTVSVYDPPTEYTDVAALMGARLTFRHTATVTEDGKTVVTAHASLAGPLSRLWATVMGRGFRDAVPTALARLVELVEQ